jgi:hypothetical protein
MRVARLARKGAITGVYKRQVECGIDVCVYIPEQGANMMVSARLTCAQAEDTERESGPETVATVDSFKHSGVKDN